MSPRAGGEADKFGARYEVARWVVRLLLGILAGDAERVRLEPGDEVDGSIELEFVRANVREVHQVKRQQAGRTNWTLNDLEREGVLTSAASYVRAGSKFVFVSTIPSHPLEELSDRARRSDDASIFTTEMLTSRDLRNGFETLAGAWGSPEQTWRILREIEVRHDGEASLRETNLTIADFLIDAPASAAVSELASIAFDTIGRTLDAEVIWEELGARGLRAPATARRQASARAVASLTGAWVTSRRAELLEPEILRPATAEVVERLKSGSSPLLLAGHAGGGKSAVLLQVAEALAAESWPLLALRLDRLSSVPSADLLGRELGLEGSPVVALATLASGRSCVLLIDQLDAVSLISGRVPELFDVVTEMLHQVEAFPNMTVVMSCRKFDLDHDHRLSRLLDRERSNVVEVETLPREQVESAVAAMGLDPTGLTPQQFELLSSPIHLVLLRSVADQVGATGFTSSRQLFDLYWAHKRRVCSQRNPRPRFEAVVYSLVEYVTAHRQLSAPTSILDADGLVTDAEVLVSEHVLVQEGGRFAFFHESFFDYAFARHWGSSNRSLLEFLDSRDQELFRRAQVRQVLLHLRDDESERFLEEVRTLLTASSVRFHIKQSILALLHGLHDPGPGESHLMASLLPREDLRPRVRLALRSVAWFDALLRDGLLESWLSDEQQDRVEFAVDLLSSAADARAGDVARLLWTQREHVMYPAWLRWVVRVGSMERGRELFDLVLHGVRSGVWDEQQHLLWMCAHRLADEAPAWSVELLRAWFCERPDSLRRDAQGKVESLTSSDHSLKELLRQTAEKAPHDFAVAFLPFLVQVVSGDTRGGGGHHFSYRVWRAHIDDVEDAVLSAVRDSVRRLANDDGTRARRLLESIVSRDEEVLRHVLYEGLAAAGPTLADWAGRILVDEGNLRVGYSRSPYWTTRETINATAPHMSDGVFAELERTLLEYRPANEQRVEARRSRGRARFVLMSALPEERLSERARRALGELRRKFDRDTPPQPESAMVGVVRSPIALESARKMTDDQWRRAIGKYDDEGDSWRFDLRGGAHELSQVLESVTKENPDRFARFGLGLDRGANPASLGDPQRARVYGGANRRRRRICPDQTRGQLGRFGRGPMARVGSSTATRARGSRGRDRSTPHSGDRQLGPRRLTHADGSWS